LLVGIDLVRPEAQPRHVEISVFPIALVLIIVVVVFGTWLVSARR